MRAASAYALVDVELLGGAMSEPLPSAAAFFWRDALYGVGIFVLVPKDTKHAEKVFRQETQTVDRLWRKRMMGLLQGSLPNYAMASLDNAVEVLYGDNF